MYPSIVEQVVTFYDTLFDQIFAEPFRAEITDLLKRKGLTRQIEEAADAASQSLTRFELKSKVEFVMPEQSVLPTEKISPQFQARLRILSAGSCLRVLVMLGTEGTAAPEKPPRTRAERQELAQAVRALTESAFSEIDVILAQTAGKRLAERPNALGAISVETTPEGIRALAASSHVKTILEDQALVPFALRQSA